MIVESNTPDFTVHFERVNDKLYLGITHKESSITTVWPIASEQSFVMLIEALQLVRKKEAAAVKAGER